MSQSAALDRELVDCWFVAAPESAWLRGPTLLRGGFGCQLVAIRVLCLRER